MPVAVRVGVEPAAVVLDEEVRQAVLPRDLHADVCRVGVLDYVAERFLSDPEEELLRLAAQLDLGIDFEPGLEPP